MDGDGKVEVIAGKAILNGADGTVRGTVAQGTGLAISVVADIDVDGVQEYVAGNAAYGPTGQTLWTNGKTDGWVGVADMNLDAVPDIIVTGAGRARMQTNKGVVVWDVALPGGGGGPPTIADYDGAHLREPRQGSSLPPRCRNRSGNWRGLKTRRAAEDSAGAPRVWRNAGGARTRRAALNREQAARRAFRQSKSALPQIQRSKAGRVRRRDRHLWVRGPGDRGPSLKATRLGNGRDADDGRFVGPAEAAPRRAYV